MIAQHASLRPDRHSGLATPHHAARGRSAARVPQPPRSPRLSRSAAGASRADLRPRPRLLLDAKAHPSDRRATRGARLGVASTARARPLPATRRRTPKAERAPLAELDLLVPAGSVAPVDGSAVRGAESTAGWAGIVRGRLDVVERRGSPDWARPVAGVGSGLLAGGGARPGCGRGCSTHERGRRCAGNGDG
jgi:hypothetical protein